MEQEPIVAVAPQEETEKKEEKKEIPVLTDAERDALYNDSDDDYEESWQKIHNK